MKLFFLFALLLMASSAWSLDVCQTKYTLMHLAESRCLEVERPIGYESFNIRSVVVSKKLADIDTRPLIVMIPGGPGESHGPLRRALQEREILNAILHGFNHNIVMFDPRGTGGSLLPRPVTTYQNDVISTANFVDDLNAVIDATSQNQPVILMAHSAGGQVALEMAIKYPSKVKKIILMAASPSARLMGVTNLEFFETSAPEFLTKYLRDFSYEERQDLLSKFYFIEDYMAQQLKARVLKKHVHLEFQKQVLTRSFKDPRDFRNVLRIAIEVQSQVSAANRIQKIYQMIKDVESSAKERIIPEELRMLKLDPTPLTKGKHSNKEWIQKIIMCGEGLSKSELSLPIFYDGRTMNYFCDGIYNKSGVFLNNERLERVTQPVLVLAGDKDTQVPFSLQRDAYAHLPNAKFVVIKDGGHTFFRSHPMDVYNALEKFLVNSGN